MTMAIKGPTKLQAREVSPYITQKLGIDIEGAARQKSIPVAWAFFLHDAAVPAVIAGKKEDNSVYPAHHALTYGQNLFAESYVETETSREEPVVVTLMPDGTVSDFRSTRPQGDGEFITRVDLRGVSEGYAQDCAWLLHALFSERGGLYSFYKKDGVCIMDLIVRGTKTLGEPAIVERTEDGGVLMTFRFMTKYSRV